MRISVIGAGYVGLVAAACLAKLGNRIILVDVDKDKLKLIASGTSPIHEPGLDEILSQVDIETTPDYQRIVDAEVILICVGTPANEDGSMSLEYIVKATKQIAEVLKRKRDYCVVSVKSTVVPGTTEEVVIPILEASGKRAGDDFGVCMDPEFLRAGRAVYCYMNPARIIIGEYDSRSGDMLLGLYKSLNAPIMRTNLKTAEMIKLASNTFLATKVSFINEIGNICKQLGIDTYEVAKGMGFDERIGSKFLNAGIGFSGSCIPKDLRALVAKARQVGYEPGILESVLSLNDEQALLMIELLRRHVSLKGASIGILGLAFKPGTDDVRESRAIRIAEILIREEARVKAYDPFAAENFKKLFPQIEYTTPEEVLRCDAILIVTEWEEFEHLDYRGKIVIDGRRISKAREARVYEGVCW
jgi:UDPglucose 6-dehydrogenase